MRRFNSISLLQRTPRVEHYVLRGVTRLHGGWTVQRRPLPQRHQNRGRHRYMYCLVKKKKIKNTCVNISKVALLVFRVHCGTLTSNQECECVMEFPLIHFNDLMQGLSRYVAKSGQMINARFKNSCCIFRLVETWNGYWSVSIHPNSGHPCCCTLLFNQSKTVIFHS